MEKFLGGMLEEFMSDFLLDFNPAHHSKFRLFSWKGSSLELKDLKVLATARPTHPCELSHAFRLGLHARLQPTLQGSRGKPLAPTLLPGSTEQ